MKLLSFCFSLLLIPTLALCAKETVNLYALIVTDPHTSPLSVMYEQDASTMQRHLQEISSRLGTRLHMQNFAGQETSKKKIARWVNSIPKSKKNIIFLYYVGKGVWENGSKRPSMCLVDRTLPQKEITQKLRTAKPKLVLSFFDCYDKVFTYQHETKLIKERDNFKNKFTHAKSLFLHAKGYIMGSSSSSPDSSYGIFYKDQPIGGFFSAMLFDSLKNGQRSWKWQFSVMNHHLVFLKNFKQNFLLSNRVDKRNSNEPICKSFKTCL